MPRHLTTALGRGQSFPHRSENPLYKNHILPPKGGLLVSRPGLSTDAWGGPWLAEGLGLVLLVSEPQSPDLKYPKALYIQTHDTRPPRSQCCRTGRPEISGTRTMWGLPGAW